MLKPQYPTAPTAITSTMNRRGMMLAPISIDSLRWALVRSRGRALGLAALPDRARRRWPNGAVWQPTRLPGERASWLRAHRSRRVPATRWSPGLTGAPTPGSRPWRFVRTMVTAPRAPKLPQATLSRAGPNAGDVMARSPAGRQPAQRETVGIDLRGLTGRIAAAGLILLLLIGGSFAGLYVAIEELRSADAQVTRSSADLRAANHIERLLVDMETGLRGFVDHPRGTISRAVGCGPAGFPRRGRRPCPERGCADPGNADARRRGGGDRLHRGVRSAVDPGRPGRRPVGLEHRDHGSRETADRRAAHAPDGVHRRRASDVHRAPGEGGRPCCSGDEHRQCRLRRFGRS